MILESKQLEYLLVGLNFLKNIIYIEKIIRNFKHYDCKPILIPYDPNLLNKNKNIV